MPVMCFGPIYGSYMKYINKVISDAKAKATEVAEEAFSNIRTVKAFATEDAETVTYFERNEKVFEAEISAGKAYGVFQFMITFVMFGTLDALIYFAAYLVRYHGFNIGNFATFQF